MPLKIQKALHLYLEEKKKKPNHLGHNYHVFEKFDGWYLYIECIGGVWQAIQSKKHRDLPSMKAVTRWFQERIKPTKVDIRLKFEGCLYEEDGSPMIFSKLNGMFNQQHTPLKRGVIVDSKTHGKVNVHDIKLKVHDLILLNNRQGLDKRFGDRYEMLKHFTRSAVKPEDLVWFNVVELLGHSNDPENWKSIYEFIITKYDHKGEGIILKRSDAGYSPDKRNYDLMKIKCEKSFELRVTGVREGEGKYKGTLGKLQVTDAIGNINYVSGMSDYFRNLWWETPNLIVGQVVEVACMQVLPNKSLREGRFKAIRYDKDYPDEL